ncbi:MAG: hypothetical protein QXJ17_06175 [Nitrososphaeria archaeon]
MEELSFKHIYGKRTLIIGEVKTGKTKLTAKLLDEAIEMVSPKDITAIDLSPTIIQEVGRTLSKYTNNVSKVRYLFPEVVRAPRLEGKSRDEVLSLAERNRLVIEPILRSYLINPSKVLFINDLSIFLHSGSVETVIECMEKGSTFIANSYYGRSIGSDKGSGINRKERAALKTLFNHINLLIKL